MAAGVTIKIKRKAGAFTGGQLAAGELGLDTTNSDLYSSNDGATVYAVNASGLTDLIGDTTPQLGGMLDINGQAIGDGTLELLTFIESALAVNHAQITNAATGSGPSIDAVGDDVNIPLNLDGKGSGAVTVSDSDLNVTGTLGVTGSITVTGTVDGIDIATDVAANTAKTGVTTEISDIVSDTTPQLGGELDAQSNKIVSLADPTAAQDGATKAYVDAVAQGLNWQPSVLDTQTTAIDVDPGVSPTTGDRYIIEDAAALHANFLAPTVSTDDILEWNGSAFVVDLDVSAVGEGYAVYDEAANATKVFNGTAWTFIGGAADHNTLSNLASGDVHTQYSLIASGASAPVSTPARIGLIYVETTTPTCYFSTGSAGAGDWQAAVSIISTLDSTNASGMTIDGGTL